MATLQLSIPDDLAREAEQLGLLTPTSLESILRQEIRRIAFNYLLSIPDKLRAAGVEPMTEEEVVAEVRAARAESHETGCAG
ncbi:hypothetical protein GJ699_13960 [Duganella sp. FT80W]|uniref:CopG family transcriptional regulator n=1 Tax=Duganella guangzhouensis TaxID=2666084 RepID=A0A6I2L1L3_9BURK|nr:hypothetical protein [Duganella guangzhouensis]MRW91097.1 hypothetical protein [Duganella guangzhouensis]